MKVQNLDEKGWHFKNARDQFRVQVCPLCGDPKWHFYINADTGAWDCKKCFAKDNYWQLINFLDEHLRRSESGLFLVGCTETGRGVISLTIGLSE